MGGGRAPARQGAPTAAIAASPARNHHSGHLPRVAVSSAHAGMHAHTGGWGCGDAAVGGMQGVNAGQEGQNGEIWQKYAPHN